MSAKVAQTRLTAEQFAEQYEGQRVELVRGEVVEDPVPPNWTHAGLMARLSLVLSLYVVPRRLGIVYAGDPGLIIERDPDTVRGPDVAFVAAHRVASVPTTGFSDIIPDLVVEVLSPSDSQRTADQKVREFLAAGVPLLWYFDPMEETVAEHVGRDPERVLQGDDILDGRNILPGFRMRVADIFDASVIPTFNIG